MLARDADRILAQLKIKASLDHLSLRILYWAGFVYCIWILLCAASFLFDYGQLNFHIILLSSLTLLPAFLIIPFANRSFIKTLRPFDIQTTIESYISGNKAAVTRLQEKQTEEIIRIVSMNKFKKKRPNALWTIGVGACTLLFFLFQLVSLKTGHGFFVAYVDRPQQQSATHFSGEDRINEYDYRTIDQSSPNSPEQKAAQASMGTRDLRKEKLDRDEENFPSLVLGDKEKTQATQESKESAKTGETLPAKKTVPEKEGRNNLDRNPGEEKPANPDPDARSLNPGHEGSGTALQNNPLLAYTAYFERLFLEHSGEQTALSQIQSEPEFASLIASYYSSFTAIIDIKLQYDPMITAAKQSWLSAFKAGAKN